MEIKDGEYGAYTNCIKCNSWIEAKIIIKNGIFVGIKNVRVEKGEKI